MEQMRRGVLLACVLALPLFMGADGCGGGGFPWPPKPTATPGPTPVPTPTPEPTPTPPSPQCVEGQSCGCWHKPPGEEWQQFPPCPTPTPTPVPTMPPPAISACPTMPLAEGARVYMVTKRYGQGLDSTVRVYGDPELCMAVHGVQTQDCHLDGMPAPWTTVGCEMALLGATVGKAEACPIWQYRSGGWAGPCVDDQGAAMSCDHFGKAGGPFDDPKTPAFEGEPRVCGEQRGQYGPIAGFFTIAHGKGEVRVCRPDGLECGTYLSVDH